VIEPLAWPDGLAFKPFEARLCAGLLHLRRLIMKFKVRTGFVLKRVDIVEVDVGGGTIERQERTSSAYQDEVIDLNAEQALEHLHQLEPVDKDAKAFVESRFVAQPAAVASGGAAFGADALSGIQAAIAAGIQAGVAAAQAAAAEAATPAATAQQ